MEISSIKKIFESVFLGGHIFILLIAQQSFAQTGDNIDPAIYLKEQVLDKNPLNVDSLLFVTILNKELNSIPISPLLPGYLFEMGYGDMESGLWGEMIFNRHFEPFPPYKSGHDWWYGLRKRDKVKTHTDINFADWRTMDWYHSAYEHNSWYAGPGKVNDYHIDERSTLFQLENENSTAKIELLSEDGFVGKYVRVKNISSINGQGIAQNGKYLRRGVHYTFKGYFRKVDKENVITISLYPQENWEKPIASVEIDNLNMEWQQKTIHFKDLDYEGFSTLLISINANSAVDMDALSLMPEDAISGWRTDAVEMIRNEVKPGVLRWPGGCYASYYLWKDGIGERDRRPVKVSGHWGGFAYNDVGTLEYVDFCEKIGAEPFICLNLFDPLKEKYLYSSADRKTMRPHGYNFPEITDLDKGAQLAAEWVAYCNLPAGAHPMADLRVKHGREEPANVKYWELENEAFRWFNTAEKYAKACVVYAKAMKAVDPSVKLGMCTYGNQLSDGLDTLLQIAGMYVDFLADRGTTNENIKRKTKIIGEYNKNHNTEIKYTNTEYFVESFDPVTINALKKYDIWEGKGRNLVTASWGYSLGWANLLMQWQRYGGDIVFTCFNSFVNDHLNSVIETPKEGAFLKYPAVIGKLFRETPARWLLSLQGYEPDARRSLQVQAAWNTNRTNLVIYLFNSRPDPEKVSFNLIELNRNFKYSKATCIVGPKLETIRSVKEPNPMVRAEIVYKDIVPNNGVWTTLAPPESFVQIELSTSPF